MPFNEIFAFRESPKRKYLIIYNIICDTYLKISLTLSGICA